MNKLKLILLSIIFLNTLYSKDTNWKKFNDGLVEAKKLNKVILVDVYTDWCKWCKEMDKNVYSNKNIQKYLNEYFVSIKLNAEGSETYKYKNKKYSAPEISQFFNVDGYPATVFLTSSGEFITLLPGYVEKDLFQKVLVYIKEEKYKTIEFDKYLETLK